MLLFSANSLFLRKVIFWKYIKPTVFYIKSSFKHHYVHYNAFFFFYYLHGLYSLIALFDLIDMREIQYEDTSAVCKIHRERIRRVCTAISTRLRSCAADTRFLHPATALNWPINYASSLKGELTWFIFYIIM